MNNIETIFLGLTQGFTEFIPVSSSGHLVIMQQVFLGASNHLFIEFINIGTLLALIVFFRARIADIARKVVADKDITLVRNIFLTAAPAGAVGLLMSDFINSTLFFGSVSVVAAALAAVGAMMILLDKLPKASPVTDGERLGGLRAFAIGLAQTIALIPGVSRSGATIIAGRLAGMNPAHAAEYSFLASIPVMLGVTLKNFVKASDRIYFLDNLPVLLISNTAAFIAGIIAISFLMRFLSRHGLAIFGWYRVGLATVLTVYLLVK